MSPTREIVTLQFGNYSNYIGAHWWNLQESGFTYGSDGKDSEICHDVLYRSGFNHNKQETFTPRMLLVDLDGSLKHLPQEGELYGNCLKRAGDQNNIELTQCDTFKKLKEDVSWESDAVEVVAKPESTKHEFQSDLDNAEVNMEIKNYHLEQSVESWADFLYTRYHPRTVNVINEYCHNPQKEVFDTYPCGVQKWRNDNFEDDFCNRIRQYVEECDYLQGFQVICDSFNGFTGMAAECLAHLSDEYGRTILTIPVYSPRNVLYENADEVTSDSIRLVNSALSFQQYVEHASLFIPLSTSNRVWRQLGSTRKFNYLSFADSNLYQTSSILAAYLDTVTLRYRLKNSSTTDSLSDFCAHLNNYGRKLAAAGLALPFTMPHDMDLIDWLDKLEEPLLYEQLTPNCELGLDNVVQSLCVRGIPKERLKKPPAQAKEQLHMPAYRCQSLSEMLQMYIQYVSHNSIAHITATEAPMYTRTPFPTEIFDKRLTINGFVNHLQNRAEDVKVQSVPCLATALTSSKVRDMLESFVREGKRIKIAKLNRFKAAGLEADDYTEALESLQLFQDNYDSGFQL